MCLSRLPRLYLDTPLASGAHLALSPEQHHYLTAVMRVGPGGGVRVFNGRDGEWQAQLSVGSARRGGLVVETLLKPQREEPGPWLLFAAVKKAALDLIVQKATELGAARIVPVITDHAVIERVNPDRMRRTAIEAAEQCGRLSIPEIGTLGKLPDCLAVWPVTRPLLVACERGPAGALADVLAGMAGQAPTGHGLLTGPEGGFSSTELDAFAKLTFVTPVNLGPRILRAETAAFSLLACYQAWVGDWRVEPRADS
jgi:16S rRNA (uracil1498-N3)-methyltransferase